MKVIPFFAPLVIALGCSASQMKEPPVPAPPSSPEGQAPGPPREVNAPQKTEEADEAQADQTPADDLPSGAIKTTDERRDDLDEELDESLREFDKLILREQEILEERHEVTAAEAAANAGGGAGEGAGGGGSLDEGPGEETAASAGGTGGSPDAPEYDESGAPTESGETTAETRNGRVPPDVGDGSDDDIVARQLREAAMSEEDPELREKLWDEYRAYKAGLDKKK